MSWANTYVLGRVGSEITFLQVDYREDEKTGEDSGRCILQQDRKKVIQPRKRNSSQTS